MPEYYYPNNGELLILFLAPILMVYGLAMIVAGPKGAAWVTKKLRQIVGGMFTMIGHAIIGERKKKKKKH